MRLMLGCLWCWQSRVWVGMFVSAGLIKSWLRKTSDLQPGTMRRNWRLFFFVQMELQAYKIPQPFQPAGEAFLAVLTDWQRSDELLPPF